MTQSLLFILLVVGCSNEHSISWDSNHEPTMKEYRVMRDGELTQIVQHIQDQVRQQTPIPGEPACYRVVAVNEAQQESIPSEEACLR